MTRPQQAIRDLFDVKPGLDRLGNLRPMPGIFPDQDAPIVRHSADGDREAVILRWGMPPPSSVLHDNPKAPGVTNVRNLKSPHWRRWLKDPAYRCLVPVTSFAEPIKGGNAWFAFGRDRPLFAFAGIWTSWEGERLKDVGKPRRERVQDTWELFGFLTTEPNAVVAPIHHKAMPVILNTEEDFDIWLTAPFEKAQALARPYADKGLEVVLEGPKADAQPELRSRPGLE